MFHVRNRAKGLCIGAFTFWILASGCVRRTPPPLPQSLKTAFEPLSDNPRAVALQSHLKQKPDDINARFELARLYEEFHLYEEALKQYAAVLPIAPTSTLWNQIGLIYGELGDFESAETAARNALALSPDSTAIRNNLGVFLVRRGNLDGALEQFQITVDAAAACNNVAVVLFEAGQYEKSREYLVKALAIKQDFAPAIENLKLAQQRIERRPEER